MDVLRLLELRNLEMLFLSGREAPPLKGEHVARMKANLDKMEIKTDVEQARVDVMFKILNNVKPVI